MALKLPLSELGLYNRDKELSILLEGFRRVKGNIDVADAAAGKSLGSSEFVLVAGRAGTGKSALIRKLRDDRTSDSATSVLIFASGKFDDTRATGRPFEALRTAFGEVVEVIMDIHDEAKWKRMGETIRKTVGSEGLEVLGKLVPGVHKLIGEKEDDETSSTTHAPNRLHSAEALNRLKFALSSFLRTTATSSYPIILFLDDLQWADEASLDLIRSIVSDTKLRHLLLVGAYREEEVDERSHPLAIMARNLEKNKTIRPITRIRLDNLDVATISNLISGLLRLEVTDVAELSEFVHQRTGGNAFFVLQFLSMLQVRDLLTYSLATYKWVWNIDEIRSETNISDNVVDLVGHKINSLPDRVTAVLKLMACLPSSKVDVPFLGAIMQGLDMEEFRNDNNVLDKSSGLVVEVLQEASEAGLVEMVGLGSYKFTHDRVRESAYSLIPEGKERNTFHLRIGQLVLQMLESQPDKQWMKFVAADQCNHGVEYITDEKQKLDLVTLNLEAGDSAMSVSAFVPASNLFSKGIALLSADEDRWSHSYDLSLKLYSAAAEVAHCTGNFESHRQLADEVLTNASCLQDELPVYSILIESLTAQQKLEEALTTGFQVLAALGQRFPTRFLSYQVDADYKKTKKMLRGYTDDDLVSLPTLEDENVIVAARLMMNLARVAFFLQKPEYMVLLLLRHLQLMLRFGANGDTPYAFVTFGMLLCGRMGDIKEGHRFGKLALKLLEQYNDHESRVVLLAHSFIVHWQSPIQESIDPILQAHKVGMAAGDVVNAFLCSVAYGYFFYHSGLPLNPLEADARAYCQQMQEYKQEVAFMELVPLWQGVLNLMGRSEDPVVLTGEAMTQDDFLRDAGERRIPTAKQKVCLVRMELAYLFGDLDLAIEMCGACEKLTATITAHMLYEVFTFFSGLVYIEQARRTGKRVYKTKAREIIHKLKLWVKDRDVNCVHKLWLLEAEYSTLNVKKSESQRDKIMSTYDSAISAATRVGLLRDAAIANERAGIWFESLKDDYWAESYLSQAHRLYCEWGAIAKADHLSRHCRFDIVSRSEELAASRFARGKSHFDIRTSAQHQSVSFTEMSVVPQQRGSGGNGFTRPASTVSSGSSHSGGNGVARPASTLSATYKQSTSI